MKLLSFKSIFGVPEGNVQTQLLRKSLLNRLMVSTCAIGLLLYGLGLIPVFSKTLAEFPAFYTILYIWLLVITFYRRIPYLIRTAGWLFIFYALGLINLFLNGLNVDAGLFFLSLVAMAALLIGLQGGVIAFGVSAITVLIMGYFINTGRFEPLLRLPQTDPLVWIIGGVIFLIMGVVLVVTLTTLLRGLEANLENSMRLTDELEHSFNKLKESEERYRNLVELSSDLVVMIGLDKRIISTNQSGSNLLDYESADELTGKDFLSFIAPNDRPLVDEAFAQVLKTGSVRDVECTALRRDGSPFFAAFSASSILDSAGKPLAVISVGKDITLRKQAELSLLLAKDQLEESVALRTTELRSTNERLDELVERSPAVIYSARPAGEYDVTTITGNVMSLLGYTPEQFHDDPSFWKNHIHMEDAPYVLREIEQVVNKGRVACEYRFLHQDGNYRWIRDERKFVQDADGSPMELVGSWVDVTERKLAEEAYRALVEQTTLGLILFQEGKVLLCNQAFSGMVGLTIGEILAFPQGLILQHILPEDRGHAREIIDRLYEGKTDAIHYETKFARNDGQIRWLEINARQVEYGLKRTFQGVVIDNTERKMAEDALQQSEARYRTLAEAAHDMIFILDREDTIRYVNTFAASQFNSKPDKLVGKSRARLFGADVSGQQSRSLTRVFETGEPFYAETKTGFPDHNLWLGTWLVPIKDEQGAVVSVMGVSRDISEGKLLEQSLEEAKELLEQRVAARTAELAAGNAQLRKLTQEVVMTQEKERQRVSRQLHDEAGQALIGLRYSLSALLADLPSELFSYRDRLMEMITLADRMTERIRHLAHTLRPPVLDFVGLNRGLEDFCQEFSEATNLPVSYRGRELSDASEEISISLYRFVQEALTNVLKHAQATQSKVVLDYKDEAIVLYVEDNGKGFTPSSDTKGIGIIGMQERLDLLGGRLEIKSEPGKGARVTAYVPWPGNRNIANGMQPPMESNQ